MIVVSALSPTPPFHAYRARVKVASFVAPLIFLTALMKPYMVMKGTGALVGFGFFGQPVLSRGYELLNRKVPNWQKYIELRK